MASTTLAAGDHAFANGHVYDRVDTAEAAHESIARRTAVVGQRDADLLLAVWRQFEAAACVGDGVKLGLEARIINNGAPEQAELEELCVVRGCLRIEAKGRLRIGSFAYIGDGAIISAQAGVEIGEASLVAHGVMIFDNDSHPINPHAREVQFRHMLGVRDRRAPIEVAAAPVKIGRRCWIGMNSLVMKGVSIGDNTVVASGSVVTSDLPQNVIAAGNPARVVRALTEQEMSDVSEATPA